MGALIPCFFLTGGMDEVRISNTNRSACWVGTEYNNQNSPSTFYSEGSEEPLIAANLIQAALPLAQ